VAGLILGKVKEQLGLDKAKSLLVGAAPIHQDVIKYFMRYDLPVLELYGMSENTGPATSNTIKEWRLGSVGKAYNGAKVKIHDPDKNGEGEVSESHHLPAGWLVCALLTVHNESMICLCVVRFACMVVMCSWGTFTMRKRLERPLILKDGFIQETLERLTKMAFCLLLAE